MAGFVNSPRFVWMMVWLAISFVFIIPVTSALIENTDIAPSTGPLDKDSPELISVLKSNAAYVGVTQQARMDGVIGYIDRISDGAGTTNLRWIQDDYLAAASSIPLLYTSDEITTTREEMRAQSIRFFDETMIQMAAFNGNNEELKVYTNETETKAENTFARMPDSVWLIKGSARLAAFNASAGERAALLLTLAGKGVDITDLRKISDQIDAKRTDMQVAVVQNQDGAILSLNSGIARLNGQFRSTVDETLKNHEIQLKTTAMLAMK